MMPIEKYPLETVDRVPGGPATTAFKRKARLHQSHWREEKQFPIGTHPIRPRSGEGARLLGSRLAIDFANETGSNFLSVAAREAAKNRVEYPQPKQTLKVDRLYADLLSSMPMCFNLFGPLWGDLATAQAICPIWWPDLPSTVSAIRFEWSPGRQVPGRYLENRSAFDVAVEVRCQNGCLGIVGVETKYHEHCAPERAPSPQRLNRYRLVADRSGIFRSGAVEAIIGTRLQQIWLDHLLALSLLQDESGIYSWVKFVLIHPSANPSYAKVATEYARWLRDDSTFQVRTIESMLDSDKYPPTEAADFRERYLWDEVEGEDGG